MLATGGLNTKKADAYSTNKILQAVATRDSDHDGLPDWEEALYGTDPHKADTRGLGMTDGEAVAKGLIVPNAVARINTPSTTPQTSSDDSLAPSPASNTLTAKFAQNLFILYLSAKQENGGKDLSQQDLQKIALQAIDKFSKSVSISPNFKTKNEIAVSGSGGKALRAFASSADTVFSNTPIRSKKSETAYLYDALQNKSKDSAQSALTHITIIANGYQKISAGLSVLPVPKELAGADLNLINALYRLGAIIGDFTHINNDPLTAIIAMKQYPEAVQKLGKAFLAISSVYKDNSVSIPFGTSGYMFTHVVTDIIKNNSTAKTP